MSGPSPDLILLDVMMPGMDGYEVCRRLKANSATSDIPIIFVTAMNQVEDETKGLELGGADYVTKPISVPIMKARIKTHLALYDQARDMKSMIAKLEVQASELAKWNHTLEQRVAEGVSQVDRLGRLKLLFAVGSGPPVIRFCGRSVEESPPRNRSCVPRFARFTAFTARSDPEDVMGVIGEYHEAMGQLIMAHRGTLEASRATA